MGDRYNQKWVIALSLFRQRNYAVTLGQTAYYSSSKAYVLARPWWIRHENKHKEQWKREGRIKFFFKYLWYSIRYGYEDNPYEIEARAAEKR